MTTRLDLTGSRNALWAPTIELAYRGGDLPLAGATIRLQVRLYEGAPGDPLLDIDTVGFTDRVATADDIARGFATGGNRILALTPFVGIAGMQSLPTGLNQPEAGEADRFVWDAVITYGDGAIEQLVVGSLFVTPGVTLHDA